MIMKKILHPFTFLFFMLSFISCTTSHVKSDLSSSEISEAISSESFRFVATRAFPMDLTAVRMMDNFRPRGSSTQILNINNGSGFKLDKNNLDVDLPYFGTRYRAGRNPQSNGIRFKTKNFLIKRVGKSNKTIFEIVPKDAQRVDKMYLEVFNSGRAYLSISSNDRQPISYDGYITKRSAENQN